MRTSNDFPLWIFVDHCNVDNGLRAYCVPMALQKNQHTTGKFN